MGEVSTTSETLEKKLKGQTAARVEAAAERLGLTPEQLLEISIEEKLARLDKEFLLTGLTRVAAESSPIFCCEFIGKWWPGELDRWAE